MTVQNWLELVQHAEMKDIPILLDLAPDQIQKARGAWENSDLSTQIQCIAAVCYMEGFLAGHPTLLLEANL